MKTLITTLIVITVTAVSFGQTVADQNPNFEKSLKKYEVKKDMASVQQGVTLQDTYEVKDWREVKAEQKEVKAERKHELRKMRIERDAQNRRLYNHRYNRNRYPYYNY